MKPRLSQPGEAGQAAVESALVLPLTLFIIGGLLQMGMIQQARLFTDYAAYRGARAASMEMGECTAVVRAEIAALVPVLGGGKGSDPTASSTDKNNGVGRADTAQYWIRTFDRGMTDQGSKTTPRVVNFWDYTLQSTAGAPDQLLSPNVSIDEPVNSDTKIQRIHLRLYYFYQMNIPFVNWIIAKMYYGQYVAGAYFAPGSFDPVHPGAVSSGDPLTARSTATEIGQVALRMGQYFGASPPRYVIPLYGSFSMRMFTRPDPTGLAGAKMVSCQ